MISAGLFWTVVVVLVAFQIATLWYCINLTAPSEDEPVLTRKVLQEALRRIDKLEGQLEALRTYVRDVRIAVTTGKKPRIQETEGGVIFTD